MAGRPHRDRDVDRLLAGAAGADRHRLLAGQPVLARLDGPAADGDHAHAAWPAARSTGGRGRRVGVGRHRRSECSARYCRRMPDVPALDPGAARVRGRRADRDPRDDRARRLAATRPDLLRARRRASSSSPLDEKPKRSADPHDLARVRDVLARPAVSLLVHRWDEDWSRLGWVRLDGLADSSTSAPGHAAAVARFARSIRSTQPRDRWPPDAPDRDRGVVSWRCRDSPERSNWPRSAASTATGRPCRVDVAAPSTRPRAAATGTVDAWRDGAVAARASAAARR